MKAEIVKSKEDVKHQFPCLVIDTNDDMILLAQGRTSTGCYYGTIVSSGNGPDHNSYQIGKYVSKDGTFDRTVPFVHFNGILRLSN